MLNFLVYPFSVNLLPYCLLGLAAMVEGPVTLLVGGAAASNGLLLPIPVYLSVVAGNLTADMGWYGLGRAAKLEWLERVSPKIGVDPAKIQRLQKGIQSCAPRLLFLSKLTVGFPIPTLIAAGLSRIPIRRWVGMLVLGELIKSAAFVAVGYVYAWAIQQVSSNLQIILWGITAVLLIGSVIWFKLRRDKKEKPTL